MVALEDRYWWFRGKNAILRKLLDRHTPQRPGSQPPLELLDVGCGGGAMLADLARRGNARGVDVSPAAVDACRRRGLTAAIGALPDALGLPPASMDAIVASEVIEHVADDHAAAAALVALLRPGGVLAVTVPAFQWLWGPHDDSHHHYRRYTRKRLLGLFHDQPVRVRYSGYANTALFPLMVLQRAAARLSKGKAVTGSPTPLPAPVNAAFAAIFAAEGRLMPAISLPVGGTVVAIFQRQM